MSECLMRTDHFAGLKIAGFENRRAAELTELIRQHGGSPTIVPAMREVAAQRNPEAVDFANRVMTGQVDALIFTTGSGVRGWWSKFNGMSIGLDFCRPFPM